VSVYVPVWAASLIGTDGADGAGAVAKLGDQDTGKPFFAFVGDTPSDARQKKKAEKLYGDLAIVTLTAMSKALWPRILAPDAEKVGSLTEPRAFNLMFKTYVGAAATEDDIAYLRPETAQGIFVQFKNVIDTTRVRVPFGIAQTGKAFRNEVTPRNFTFRSREFEQMEIEFFCHPDEAVAWYAFWKDFRLAWWRSIGLSGENLQLREHDRDELAHYAKNGAGTSDIEYRFPFTAPGFGELEGVAHRTDFDLRQHQLFSKTKLEYFDGERGELLPNGSRRGERYLPHVIEPSAGLDRGVLALLSEAYSEDPSRPSPEVLKLHPRIAPIKAAVFPLVNKDGMPEVSAKLAQELHARFGRRGFIEHDVKASIGKRYARMDEAGCPYCFTVDGETLQNQTVTVRQRDTGLQERIAIDAVSTYLGERLPI
jgi:glycyl-tRNA synthetase